MKKKLSKLTPDVIPEKVVEKLCDLDFFNSEKYEKLKREMMLTESPVRTDITLSENESVKATTNDILSNAIEHCIIQKAGANISVQAEKISVQGQEICVQAEEISTQTQEIPFLEVGRYMQYEQYHLNDSNNSSKIEDILKQNKMYLKRITGSLIRSISLPDVLNIEPKDASTQTDTQYVNPLLRNNLMPFGMFLPHAPVFSPLAALILPLGNKHLKIFISLSVSISIY